MKNTRSPQFVIHIGDPKTGTTSIQKALQTDTIACATRRILPWHEYNAVQIARSFNTKAKAKREEQFGQVREWLQTADADIAVLSSEDLAPVAPMALLQALRSHVPDHAETAQVIAYVRPHASRYLAAYIQRTKTGQYLGEFEDFFARIQANDPLLYAPRFGHWREVFQDRFTLKPFIRSELRGHDIVTDFAATLLGNEPFDVSQSMEENVATPLRALSGLRHMQRCFAEAGVKAGPRRLLGAATANHFLPSGPVQGEKPALDHETTSLLIKTYLEDAKALDAAFFSKPLMQTELTSSLSKAVGQPLDMSVSRHFTPAEVQRLGDLSAVVAQDFQNAPLLWRLRHRRRRFNTPLSPEQARKVAARQALLDRIDAGLQEISDILRG